MVAFFIATFSVIAPTLFLKIIIQIMIDKDTTEIILANAGALSLSLTDIHLVLQVLSVAAALIFTVIKIIKEIRRWRKK